MDEETFNLLLQSVREAALLARLHHTAARDDLLANARAAMAGATVSMAGTSDEEIDRFFDLSAKERWPKSHRLRQL